MENLSRRERQILEAVIKRGEASAQDVLDEIQDPPGYNAVRKWLTILEKKGLLAHHKEGRKYIYSPVIDEEQARGSELKRLVDTFFKGSRTMAAAALLEDADDEMSEQERKMILQMIKREKEERTP